MTASGLVGSRKNGVNNSQRGSGTDSLCSQALTRLDEPPAAGVLQCTHHGSAHGDDTPSVCAGAPDCVGGRLGYAIRFIERQPKVEFCVPRGRGTGGGRGGGK